MKSVAGQRVVFWRGAGRFVFTFPEVKVDEERRQNRNGQRMRREDRRAEGSKRADQAVDVFLEYLYAQVGRPDRKLLHNNENIYQLRKLYEMEKAKAK